MPRAVPLCRELPARVCSRGFYAPPARAPLVTVLFLGHTVLVHAVTAVAPSLGACCPGRWSHSRSRRCRCVQAGHDKCVLPKQARALYTHLLAARRASFGSTAPSALTPCCCETDARHSAAVKAKSVNIKMSRDEAFKILDLEEKSAVLNAIREVPWPLSPSPSFLPPAVTPPRFCNSF